MLFHSCICNACWSRSKECQVCSGERESLSSESESESESEDVKPIHADSTQLEAVSVALVESNEFIASTDNHPRRFSELVRGSRKSDDSNQLETVSVALVESNEFIASTDNHAIKCR